MSQRTPSALANRALGLIDGYLGSTSVIRGNFEILNRHHPEHSPWQMLFVCRGKFSIGRGDDADLMNGKFSLLTARGDPMPPDFEAAHIEGYIREALDHAHAAIEELKSILPSLEAAGIPGVDTTPLTELRRHLPKPPYIPGGNHRLNRPSSGNAEEYRTTIMPSLSREMWERTVAREHALLDAAKTPLERLAILASTGACNSKRRKSAIRGKSGLSLIELLQPLKNRDPSASLSKAADELQVARSTMKRRYETDPVLKGWWDAHNGDPREMSGVESGAAHDRRHKSGIKKADDRRRERRQ